MPKVKVKVDTNELKNINIIDNQLMMEIGEDLVGLVKEQMYNQIDVYGKPYKKMKKKPYGDRKTLIKSGAMWGQTHYEIDGNTLHIINDKEYSSYHNEGDGVPRRQYIPTESNSDIEKIVEHAINNRIKKIK